MNIKAKIPNFITLLNLLSGCIAVVFVARDQFELAFFFVCLGIFLDFFDGFFARLFKVQSPLGVQLDSLADMVTSGLVPGYVMYKLLLNFNKSKELVSICERDYKWLELDNLWPFLGFIITLGSCYRLAKFNIDTRQTDSFIGLPTPANALFILSIPLVIASTEITFLKEALTNSYILMVISILSVYMMNAEISLFSLKMKNFSWQNSKFQIIFLLLAVILIVTLKIVALPIIILLYVLMSVIQNKMTS
ncbi:CDP-alcohol phosphatidyltransferase family protein [Flavobacterium azooxidireducens]|uniref:CDP-alcohol phosphatidyltransferase family protein n=1 Tax=Flavobacterium azooxidireducens TaxID=1871076 RepID=A0ABY4KFS2_9FLAO|nr:CDP-alcohol phosphatidyltransferase family protein [Flavobacterium azooxidireducens]UPQ79659.1 CDP-alcohol phosphatidyltransferase family protein [Flavobacterium azooxidireducens]